MNISNLLAAGPSPHSLGGDIGGEGLGPFGSMFVGSDSNAAAISAVTGLARIVSSFIGVMTIVALLWFIMNVLIGGFNWLQSGGDKHKLEEARNRITNAFIGLIIVTMGWTLLALAGQFFGIDILLTNPSTILNLTPNP